MGGDLTESRNASRYPGVLTETRGGQQLLIKTAKAVQSCLIRPADEIVVSLLTGGSDRPYVFGLTTSLMSKGVSPGSDW